MRLRRADGYLGSRSNTRLTTGQDRPLLLNQQGAVKRSSEALRDRQHKYIPIRCQSLVAKVPAVCRSRRQYSPRRGIRQAAKQCIPSKSNQGLCSDFSMNLSAWNRARLMYQGGIPSRCFRLGSRHLSSSYYWRYPPDALPTVVAPSA